MTIFYEKRACEGVRTLSEEESKHCTQVLRHKIGDEILVFDGNGGKYHSVLTQISKKSCEFDIISSEIKEKKSFSIHLAIAPTKSTDRMEWMIEKLCEIGVDKVSFIQTQHSERRKLRIDRMEKKVISAMKQSGNPFKMEVNEINSFSKLIDDCTEEEKWIAHVSPGHQYLTTQSSPNKSTLILIGPEGDFSKEEVTLATERGFRPISLGANTLRTETAGFVACCMINTSNHY
jgi:16S rRNA (uracil1498-N3)-methyltransferase